MAADSNIFGLPDLPAGAPAAKLWEAVFYEDGAEGTYRRPADITQQSSTAFTNSVRGGPKLVSYLDSRFTGVPDEASTLDRIGLESLALGNEAWVINPSATPLSTTEAAKKYVLLPVAANTAGALQVYIDAQPGTTAKAPARWQEYQPTGGGGLTDAQARTIVESYYNTYAATATRQQLASLKEFQDYVLTALGTLSNSQIPAKPAAPTAWQTDDTANAGSFKVVTGFAGPGDYETEITNNGTTMPISDLPPGSYEQNGRIVIPGLAGNIPAGKVRVRVKASGSRPASDWLPSNAAFTSTVGPPPNDSFPYTFDAPLS